MVVRFLLLAAWAAAVPSSAQAPGMPALQFPSGDLFKSIGALKAPAGTSWGNAVFHKGHFIVGIDVNEDSAGFQVYDIRDPRLPRLVHQKYDAESRRLREIQGYAFALGHGADLVAIPSHAGLEIWDFSNPAALKRHGAVALAKGGGKGIYNGVISAAWQPPYIYCGAMDNGVFVVDARNPAAPKMVKRLDNSVIGGRLGGPAYVLGNLLVVTTMEDAYQPCAVTTFDISDPADPQVIDLYQCATREGSYTAFMSGNRIYGQGVDGYLLVYELTPRHEVNKAGQATGRVARGGYGVYQDGYVHSGMSDWYIKYDARIANPTEVGRFHVLGDNDWVMPLGNLVFVGDDDGPASEGALVPHQAGLDTAAPRVNYAVPSHGATQLPITSRVGLSFTDNIDPATVDTAAFQVRPKGGAALPGKFSVLMGLVNFTPDAPLRPDTDYEIRLKAGGLKDWAGNGIRRDTVLAFATGAATALRPPARAPRDLRPLRRILAGCPDPGLAPLPSGLRDPLGRSARPAAGLRIDPAAR